MSSVVLSSGGMDSSTLLWDVATRNDAGSVHALSVDYGQRHRRELESARAVADLLDNVRFDVVDLQSVGALLTGSALSDPGSVDVPLGHYAEESMKLTIVPNRNAIMLNVAVGVAVAEGADRVYTAVHAGDHPVYPDCRPEFIREMNKLARVATETDVVVEAPFVHISKADIAVIGGMLGVPYGLTWSCYRGGLRHCGQCGTCTERIEAFRVSGVADPTEYEDLSAYEALKAAGKVEVPA